MFLPSTITLKPGDSGDFVAELQRRLSAIDGFNPDGINGFYDGMTTNAVSAFQAKSGIRSDGIAGPETLRRLNGVISGDTSTTSSTQAEEEAKRQAAQNAFFQLTPVQDMAPPPVVETVAYAADPYAAVAPQALQAAPAYAPPPPPVAGLPPAQPQASDILAQMLLQQVPQQQAAPLAQDQMPQHKIPAQQVPQQPGAPTNTLPPAAAALQTEAGQTPAGTPAPQEQAPRGMVGKAMQYANELVQKLANYFEAKLAPSVVAEVKAIGQAMAQHGVKEVPIPQDPAASRTQELPARGPDKAPAVQRN